MLFFQRLHMGFALRQAGIQSSDAFPELGDFCHRAAKDCWVEVWAVRPRAASLLFAVVGRSWRSLPAEPVPAHRCALATVRQSAAGFGNDRLGLFMQSGRQAAHQVLQGLADGDLGAKALPFFLLQLLEVAVDRGLGTGIPKCHPHRVHRRMLCLAPATQCAFCGHGASAALNDYAKHFSDEYQ